MLELTIVCTTILAMTWIISRSMTAYYEAKRATAAKFTALQKLKARKKKGDDDEDTGSLVEALLLELGIPPALAMPVIQGYVQGLLKKVQTGPEKAPETNYT